jgi:methyl-accepting chemotaxis protein
MESEEFKTKPAKLSKRTQYIINPKFQYFMLGFVLIQSFVTIAILYALNYEFFHKFKVMGRQANIPENHIYFKFLTEQQVYFDKAILLVFALIGVFLVTTVVLISHRIAGPLYHLNKHMQEIADGKELGEVRFRDKDFFMELASSFNRMVLKIKETKETQNKDAA